MTNVGRGDASHKGSGPETCPMTHVDRFVRGRLDLTEAQVTAICLWIGHTYIYEHFKLTPKLFVTAIRHGLGKTEAMEVVEGLSCNGVKLQGTTTTSALSRLMDECKRLTLCLDQLDDLSADSRRLINMLCDGFEVGCMMRMSEPTRKGAYHGKMYMVGFPQALGMIGDLPSPALASRCITIQMQPATEERQRRLFQAQSRPFVDKANFRKPIPVIAGLRDWLAEELQPAGAALGTRRWPAPCKCEARQEEMWQPLFAVAEYFGGEWPQRAREAFCELVDATQAAEPFQARFLRYVLAHLKPDDMALTPKELHARLGAQFNDREFSLDQQGKWLAKVGVKTKVRRLDGMEGTERAYDVAAIRQAAERWKVVAESD